MKQDQNLRFVIIGMGYLMEYIAPCYSKLLGDKKAEQMLGVTAEPQAVQTKAKATGIPVILNDNAGALRRMEPDIILFAPPPSLAAPLTESVLVPYFAECRAAGKELPMLFAFPPKPEGKYYQEQLGHDCKVVNILPNMISEICGRTCAEAGFTMVTLPESHTWQPEELDFIRRFWQPEPDAVGNFPGYADGIARGIPRKCLRAGRSGARLPDGKAGLSAAAAGGKQRAGSPARHAGGSKESDLPCPPRHAEIYAGKGR